VVYRWYVAAEASAPVFRSPEEARQLLDSIDTTTLVGLRDRALIAVMTFAFARIGAVVTMRVEDYSPEGKRWWVRLHEKGGKRHEIRRITTSKPTSTNISSRPASAMTAKVPSSAQRSAGPTC
jgi:integrase